MDLDNGGAEPEPPVFPARFDGECSDCLADITEGDMITADGDGGWRHDDCDWPEGRA